MVCQDREINECLGKASRYMQFKGVDPAKTAHSISSEQPSIQDDFTLMDGFYHAPTVLYIFTLNMRYTHEDAAMMAENMWLAAHSLGVGACYIGRADEVFAEEYGRELKKKWGIEDELVAAGTLILGYCDGAQPREKPRKAGRILRV